MNNLCSRKLYMSDFYRRKWCSQLSFYVLIYFPFYFFTRANFYMMQANSQSLYTLTATDSQSEHILLDNRWTFSG